MCNNELKQFGVAHETYNGIYKTVRLKTILHVHDHKLVSLCNK